METFMDVFGTVFGGIVALIAVCYAVMTYENYRNWKRSRVRGFSKRSKKSKDFMEERESILSAIQERKEATGVNKDSIGEEMDRLNESSEFASLVRCAHYAGYHLTFEQAPYGGVETEPESADVFKTDLKKSAEHREEKKWARYRRY